MNGLDLIYEWLLGKGYSSKITSNRNGRSCVEIWVNGLGSIEIYVIRDFTVYVRGRNHYQYAYGRSLPLDIRDREFFSKLDKILPLDKSFEEIKKACECINE